MITGYSSLALLGTLSLLFLFTSVLHSPFLLSIISVILGVISIFIYYVDEPIGCSWKGGYSSVGMCKRPICLTPAKDGGRVCLDSDECKGTCVGSKNGKICPGVCSNIELKKEQVCSFKPDHLKFLGGQHSCENSSPVLLTVTYCYD